jgi:heptosyltransferase-2
MKRFLVIQTAFLGDAVLVTAILEKLHAFFPMHAIDLVVRKGNEGHFRHRRWRREQPPARSSRRKVHRFPPSTSDCTPVRWDKRQQDAQPLPAHRCFARPKYDHIINCQRFFSTGLMTVLARGKEKIGYDKNP